MAGDFINQVEGPPQAGRHGGSRPGAGRPAGARNGSTVAGEADIAAIVAEVDLAELLLLGPADVLRLSMLLAVRRGDLEMAAEHARRLAPIWEPWMSYVPAEGVAGGSRSARTVNRLARLLHGSAPAVVLARPDRPAAVPAPRPARGRAGSDAAAR